MNNKKKSYGAQIFAAFFLSLLILLLPFPLWSLPERGPGGTGLSLPCTFVQFPTIFESSVAITVPTGPVTLIPSVSDILSLAIDSHATVWAGTENGLLSFIPATNTGALTTTLQGLPFNRVTSLIPAADTLWIALSPRGPSNPSFGGLTAKDESGFRTFGTRQGLVCNWIDHMRLVDHTLYISTPRGLSFFDTGSRKFIYRREGLSAGHSVYDGRSLLLETGTVMPTTSEIVSFDMETMIMSRKETRAMLGFDKLASLAFYDNRIWATGYTLEKAKPEPRFQFRGLHIFDRHSGKLTVVSLPDDIFHDSLTLKTVGQELWFLSDRGFGFYREGKLTFHRAGDSERPYIPEMIATAALGGGPHAMWMARSPYLMKLDAKGLTCYRFTGCLSSNLITSMALAYDSLWAGTEKGTIDRLNGKGEVLAAYGREKGLPGAPVAEIFHDGVRDLYARCGEEGDSGASGELLVRYEPGLDRWQTAQSFKGEKNLDCRNFPARYLPHIAKLKLDTPEGKVLMVEGRDCSWLSTYGSGIVRIAK